MENTNIICKVCHHGEPMHWATGAMDEVTEPKYRPSYAFCEMCYYDKASVDDETPNHIFISLAPVQCDSAL